MEDGADESVGEAEFLSGKGYVNGQNPSGSKCQDEKKRVDLSGNEELLELLELLELRSDG